MWVSLLLAAGACSSGDTDSSVTTPCPGLDCRDQLTLRVQDEAGVAVTRFTATWDDGAGYAGTLDCANGNDGDGSAYCVDGTLNLFFYGPSIAVEVVDAACELGVSTTIEPGSTAPYDSEACGHYCYIADEPLVLAPADLTCDTGA